MAQDCFFLVGSTNPKDTLHCHPIGQYSNYTQFDWLSKSTTKHTVRICPKFKLIFIQTEVSHEGFK